MSADRLLPLVYDELRRVARRYFRNEPGDQTLEPTALVHEVYVRLAGDRQPPWTDRAEFFAVAARAMRHLLIDHARRRRALKRGGGVKLSIDEVTEPAIDRDAYLVALDEALGELASVDSELCRVIELRFFAGLSVDETAGVMGVSPVTVKRRWKLAKGWLHRQIVKGRQ